MFKVHPRQSQPIDLESLDLFPSEFTSHIMRMPHEGVLAPFSFVGREYLIPIYDTPHPRVLLMFARQSEKSTTLGNKILALSCLRHHFKSLFVSPSQQQTEVFSRDKLSSPLNLSDELRTFLDTDANNVLFKRFITDSSVTLRYAFLHADRCAVGSTRVHLAGGEVATLKEIYEEQDRFLGREVVCLTPGEVPTVSTGVLEDVVYQGRRQVFRVRLEGGAEHEITENQPLFTAGGWVRLDRLSVGQYVAVPYRAPHGSGNSIPDEEYRLVGYLLGDGHVTQFKNVGLSNGNREVLDDFVLCASRLGAVVGGESLDPRDSGTTVRINLYGGRCGYKARLTELGVIGGTPETKRVPRCFFTGDARQICEFLRAIYATDGWASVSRTRSGTQIEIGYCSNSRGLVVDLRCLLARYGINAVISRQKKPSTANARGAYILSIRSRKHILRFIEEVGIVGKQDALNRVRDALAGWAGRKDQYDRVALSYMQLREYLRDRHGLSTHTAWTQHRIQLRPGNVKDSVGRDVLRSIGERLSDEFLIAVAESAVGWARIEGIEDAGEQETYDLTVPGSENFLVDGLFLHNTRGIPADALFLDEIQDILTDVIPIIEECMSHSPYQLMSYSGTPKSLDNTIAHYWNAYSTQNEWMIPCDHCGGGDYRHWDVIGYDNIGPTGLICSRCKQGIDPRHPDAQWVSQRSIKWLQTPSGIPFESYRIPQILTSWVNWQKILDKKHRYGKAQFYNEVLALPYDSGDKPIKRETLVEQCTDITFATSKNFAGRSTLYMGIDWGGTTSLGGGEESVKKSAPSSSHTVVSIGGYLGGKFQYIYFRRFEGEEAIMDNMLPIIIELVSQYRVSIIGTDYGGGLHPNDRLIRQFGIRRVARYQYVNTRKIYFNKDLHHWMVNRTEALMALINAINRKDEIRFPSFGDWEFPFAQDLLSVFTEYNRANTQMVIAKAPGSSDDTMHSMLYCWLASMIEHPRPDILAADKH